MPPGCCVRRSFTRFYDPGRLAAFGQSVLLVVVHYFLAVRRLAILAMIHLLLGCRFSRPFVGGGNAVVEIFWDGTPQGRCVAMNRNNMILH